MFGKALVNLAIPFEHLFGALLEAADHLFGLAFLVEPPVDHEKVGPVPDILGGDGVEIAFAEGQVVDRIEHIGLPDPVGPHQAVDLGVEIEFPRLEILVIQ